MIISSNIVSSFVHPTVKGLRVYHCCYVNDVVLTYGMTFDKEDLTFH